MTEDLISLIALYTFDFSLMCMFAGVLYFVLERNSMALEYKMVATLAAVVAFVAGMSYWQMIQLVSESVDARAFLVDFPTHYRYIDWLITTPMLLLMIPLLLGIKKELAGVMTGLVIADVIMILAGYIGELQLNSEDPNMAIAWGGFIIAMFAFVYILFTLYAALSSYSAKQRPEIRSALNSLRLFIVLGWLIYPLGYFIALFGASDEMKIMREIIYCIADVVTKIGFGMVAVHAAKTASIVWVDDKTPTSSSS